MAKRIVAAGYDVLLEACRRHFAAGGALSGALPNFVSRPQQVILAEAILRAMQLRSTLVVEAGTGTGKTFAYLVPCLLSGKKVVISTATKTLQDQLIYQDLPSVIRALGLPIRIQNLKGRSNYICHYRTEFFAQEGRVSTAACAADIAYVREKLPQLTQGERSELPDLSESSEAWPYVTATGDNCLGRACRFHADCFVVKARQKALDADLVVINHHVFFADSRLKEEGFGALLPDVDTVVFDEAHHLSDIATDCHDVQLGTGQIRDVFDDLLREWPLFDTMSHPLQQMRLTVERALDTLWLKAKEGRVASDAMGAEFVEAWQRFVGSFNSWMALLTPDAADEPGFARCKARYLALYNILHDFCSPAQDSIRWIEKFKRNLVFHQTPCEIAGAFKSLLSRYPATYIFTSATLSLSQSFVPFIKALGLDKPMVLHLPSPFDFKTQALLYLPRGLPDPKHVDYYPRLMAKALPVISACGGRCFFLFTSHRALQSVAGVWRSHLDFPLLVQGDEAKSILLAKFRQLGNAVLLGTASFWEGVDVKGETLSCVIIDKIPFASPKDPVMQGKMRYLQARGLSAFDEISLPAAVLALKQGVGRLIRDSSDRGVLMIADPRLTGRAYGAAIFASLPIMNKTRDAQKVLSFIAKGYAVNSEAE